MFFAASAENLQFADGYALCGIIPGDYGFLSFALTVNKSLCDESCRVAGIFPSLGVAA